MWIGRRAGPGYGARTSGASTCHRSRSEDRARSRWPTSSRALERHYRESAFQEDDDLVFAHPATERPLDRSKVRKRFREALAASSVRSPSAHGSPPSQTGWRGHRRIRSLSGRELVEIALLVAYPGKPMSEVKVDRWVRGVGAGCRAEQKRAAASHGLHGARDGLGTGP
jgi:hypothetical protein